jgi:hypothetical protein
MFAKNPAGQFEQPVAPVIDWYFPVAQLKQVDEDAPPVLVEYVPAAQEAQFVDPVLT